MAMVPLSSGYGRRGAGRVFGLGNIPIPGLSAAWSLGDPQSDLWGASYYNGSKVQGKVTNPASPTGYSWETESTLYAADWDQATEDAISAAANANYAIYERWKAIQTASPEMRAILTDPEWISYEDSGKPIVWENLSAELQEKIKAVPNLYTQFTDPAKFAAQVAAAPPPPASTEPARYLQNGLETYADGTPVPGGSNALLDVIRQREAQGITPGVWSQQMIDMVNQNPALYSALPPDVQQTYARTGSSLQQQGSVSQAAAIPTPPPPPAPASSEFSSTNGGASSSSVTSGGAVQFATAGAGGSSAFPRPASTSGGAAAGELAGAPSSVPTWALLAGGALAAALLFGKRRR